MTEERAERLEPIRDLPRVLLAPAGFARIGSRARHRLDLDRIRQRRLLRAGVGRGRTGRQDTCLRLTAEDD